MKTLVFCSVLFIVAGCASSKNDGLIDHRTLRCQEGDDLSMQVGLDSPTQSSNEAFNGQLTMLVEITNNSHQDYTINAIRIDPAEGGEYRLEIVSAYKKVDQVIPENEDHLFHLPVSGRVRMGFNRSDARRDVPFVLTVLASNGDQYRCQFSIPDPSF
jgi:hypothetical protein